MPSFRHHGNGTKSRVSGVGVSPVSTRNTVILPLGLGAAYLVKLALAENHALDRTTPYSALLVSGYVWSGSKPCRPSS